MGLYRQDRTLNDQRTGGSPRPPELRVHGRDDLTFRAELISRLQDMLVFIVIGRECRTWKRA